MRKFIVSHERGGGSIALLAHPPSPPTCKRRRIARSSISVKTSSSQDPLPGRGPRLTAQRMFCSLFSEPFDFLYVFPHMLYEQEALIGLRCPLNSMEFIAYLCFVAACIDLSASKFRVHVCVSA